MRVFLSWMVPAVLVIASCGGKVVLDKSSGRRRRLRRGHGRQWVRRLRGQRVRRLRGQRVRRLRGQRAPSAFGGSSAFTGTGAGGDCVPTCAQAVAEGGVPCGAGGSALADYNSLQKCAGCSDTGNCEGICGASLCESGPSSGDCTSCLQTSCAAELFTCEQD